MGRKALLYILMFGLTVLLLEGLAFIVVQLIDRDDFFDSRQEVFALLSERGIASFSVTSGNAVTGWHNFGPRVKREDNCLGKPISYNFNAAGVRLYDGFDAASTQIVIAGDSYSRGDEIADNAAYPAQLSQRLGVSVANHAVGGYGPVQGLLSLEANLYRYPRARVVVLGIMYENLLRMMNSYRPVLYGASSYYTLKPYMRGGEIQPHPGDEALQSLARFSEYANRAFDTDFWARPKLSFPYLLSIGRAVASNHFYYVKLQRALRSFGEPEYSLVFGSKEVGQNLVALLNELARRAREWQVLPVVLFIPRDTRDLESASVFLAENRADIDPSLVVANVAVTPGVDWDRYNLRSPEGDNFCHPSPYGAGVIVDALQTVMRDNHILSQLQTP